MFANGKANNSESSTRQPGAPRSTQKTMADYPDEPRISLRFRDENFKDRYFDLTDEQISLIGRHAPSVGALALQITNACRSARVSLDAARDSARASGKDLSESGKAALKLISGLEAVGERIVIEQRALDDMAASYVGHKPTTQEQWRDADGRVVAVVGPSDPFPRDSGGSSAYSGSGFVGNSVDAGASVGTLARAMLVPSKDARVRNALGEGVDATGGVIVPTYLLPQFIDRMRAAMTAVQAGAKTLRLDTMTTSIARLDTDPVAAWRNENASITDTDPSFSKVVLTAKSVYAFVKVSIELLQDSMNAEAMLTNALAQALAQEIDRVVLFGSGTGPEPRGIFNTAGITSQSMGVNGLALANFDPIVNLAQAAADANVAQTSAMIMAPRTRYALARLKDTTGQPLQAPGLIANIPMLSTTKVPLNQTQGTSTDCSSIISGDFTRCLIGVRQELRLTLLRETYMGNMQIGLLAHMRADVAVEQPAAFARLVGIRP
jgi:HK97 family phage major capsid protein